MNIANAIIDAYLDKSLEDRIGASSRALEWLRQQEMESKADMETSEIAVLKFREEHQSLATSLDQRRKVVSEQMYAYRNTSTELRIKHVQAQARVAVLKEAIAAEPDPLAVQAGPIAPDATVLDLRKRYRDVDARIQQLAITQAPDSHQVLVAKAELEATGTQLVTQINAILEGAQADLREIECSEAGIQQALSQTHQASHALCREEIELASLERERASHAERYSAVLERTARADLERVLGASSARVVGRAWAGQAVGQRGLDGVAWGLCRDGGSVRGARSDTVERSTRATNPAANRTNETPAVQAPTRTKNRRMSRCTRVHPSSCRCLSRGRLLRWLNGPPIDTMLREPQLVTAARA